MTPRREQRPEPKKSTTRAELPLNDPNYHYRVVSKEDETADRVAYHKELGYGIAHETNRQLTMACPRDEHEVRQAEARNKADRMRESALPTAEGFVHDETSIEVSCGLASSDD